MVGVCGGAEGLSAAFVDLELESLFFFHESEETGDLPLNMKRRKVNRGGSKHTLANHGNSGAAVVLAEVVLGGVFIELPREEERIDLGAIRRHDMEAGRGNQWTLGCFLHGCGVVFWTASHDQDFSPSKLFVLPIRHVGLVNRGSSIVPQVKERGGGIDVFPLNDEKISLGNHRNSSGAAESEARAESRNVSEGD